MNNIFSIKRPDLALDWDYEKNKTGPENYTLYSGKLVYWKCHKCGYSWHSPLYFRTIKNDLNKKHYIGSKKNCLKCNSVGSKYPELINEWSEKNKKSIFEVGKTGKYWWKCKKCNFEWIGDIYNKVNGYSPCPKCKSFYVKCPFLLKEWDFKKNKDDIDFVCHGSTKKKWWKCNVCNFEWMATVNSRVSGNGCPNCQKIILKDGTKCDSLTEAFFYIKFSEENLKFLFNKVYNIGCLKKCRFDFFFPHNNKYIEVTSFHKNSFNVNYYQYLRNIVKKKIEVEKNGFIFEFIQHKLTNIEIEKVRKNIK